VSVENNFDIMVYFFCMFVQVFGILYDKIF